MEQTLFIKKFPAEIWKNIKYEIRETFQKYFGAKLLNQIDFFVKIQKVCSWVFAGFLAKILGIS